VREYGTFFPWPGVELTQITSWPKADISVAKLEPFDPAWVSTFPTLKKPQNEMPMGVSLCRLGYP
jgi:hypothetical protein